MSTGAESTDTARERAAGTRALCFGGKDSCLEMPGTTGTHRPQRPCDRRERDVTQLCVGCSVHSRHLIHRILVTHMIYYAKKAFRVVRGAASVLCVQL